MGWIAGKMVASRAFFCWVSLLILCSIAAEAQGETVQREAVQRETARQSSFFNPDLSLDGLFSFAQFNTDHPLVFEGGHDPKNNGFNIQQLELTLGAAVDPYFRADANIVLVPNGKEIQVELEEAYLTTLTLPADLQLKAGTFFTAFGRHNSTHPHAWDWADKPVVLGRFFGGDGLRNPGAQLSWLAPTPWYLEVSYSAQNASGDTAAPFLSEGSATQQRSYADLYQTARASSFVPLSDEFSLNLGASGVVGPNDATARTSTFIYGTDVYLKYRPSSALTFVSLQAEALKRRSFKQSGRLDDWGFYAQSLYHFDPRWTAGWRYDWVAAQGGPVGGSEENDRRWRMAPVLTFYPSEFSKWRLQYNYDRADAQVAAQHAVFLEFEFTIGVHGAHKF